MLTAVGFAAVALFALSVLGWATLAPLRSTHRDALLPAAPILGAALLAAVMSTTTWVFSARGGLIVTAIIAAGLVALGVRLKRRPWHLSPRAIGCALALFAIGCLGAVRAFLPSVWVGDARAASPNPSHDVFYFVSESSWLADNAISPIPDTGLVPGGGNAVPAYGPMRTSLLLPVRIGQPLVHSALDALTGQDPVDTVMVVTALWVLLVAPAAFVTGRLLRLGKGPSILLAVVSASSAILIQQAYQQNVDSLLGVSLALLTIGACVAASETRIPLWPAALALAGLVSVYSEYALFVAPAIAGGVLLRRPGGLRRRVTRAATVLGIAILLTPTSWVRGLETLMIERVPDAFDSPLMGDGWYSALSRVVGTSPLAGPLTPSRTTMVLVVLLGVGLVLALLADRHRGMWAALMLVGFGYLYHLSSADLEYSQLRAATLLLPLVLLAAVAGWAAAFDRSAGSTRTLRVATLAVAAGLIVSTAAWTLVNIRAAPRGLDRASVHDRHVDAAYDEVRQWTQSIGGREGERVTVLAPETFSQMWLTYALREERLVAYPSLRSDYLRIPSYWSGESDRYILVGPGAVYEAGTSAVSEQNARFALLDTEAGPVVAVVPNDLATWYPLAEAGGTMGGPDLATLTVLRTPGLTGRLEIRLRSTGPADVQVTVVETGETTREVFDGDAASVVLDLDHLRTATLRIDLGADDEAGPGRFVVEGVSLVQ